MFRRNKEILKKINKLTRELSLLREEADTQKILQANVLRHLNFSNTEHILDNIQLAEFRVFSQWGDDGIIQFLVDYLIPENKTFIEFGVENYTESNTRFLLLNNNWRGLLFDGSGSNIEDIRQRDLYWKYNLTAISAFITAENINELITQHGFAGELGLLHIDIDGNDYWVWKAISVINPLIVIVEYNSVFGGLNSWTTPYMPDFQRTKAHHSNLYFGSSLQSLCDLADEKGYAFIGCNSNGNNAYFIRKDKVQGLKSVTPAEGYVVSQFRESRDHEGNLTFVSDNRRIEEIVGMDVFDTRTGEISKITI